MKTCSNFAFGVLLWFSMNTLPTKGFGGHVSKLYGWKCFWRGLSFYFPPEWGHLCTIGKEPCWILHKYKSPLSKATNLNQKLLEYKEVWYWSVLLKNKKWCPITTRITLILLFNIKLYFLEFGWQLCNNYAVFLCEVTVLQ